MSKYSSIVHQGDNDELNIQMEDVDCAHMAGKLLASPFPLTTYEPCCYCTLAANCPFPQQHVSFDVFLLTSCQVSSLSTTSEH